MKTIEKINNILTEMMSVTPTNKYKYTSDAEILRAAIIAEYDAINLYLQMASITQNRNVKEVLKDIAKEEKIHVGEFETLLKEIDNEHEESVNQGKEELEEMF